VKVTVTVDDSKTTLTQSKTIAKATTTLNSSSELGYTSAVTPVSNTTADAGNPILATVRQVVTMNYTICTPPSSLIEIEVKSIHHWHFKHVN
jgi:hypothetical protein